MKVSAKLVVFILATIVWIVVGWPFARRYNPIAEGFFHFAFGLGVIVLPIFLEWLERRTPHQ